MAFRGNPERAARFPGRMGPRSGHVGTPDAARNLIGMFPTGRLDTGLTGVRCSSRTSGSGRAAGTGRTKTPGSPHTVTGEQQQRCDSARPGSPHLSRRALRRCGSARFLVSVGNRDRERNRLFLRRVRRRVQARRRMRREDRRGMRNVPVHRCRGELDEDQRRTPAPPSGAHEPEGGYQEAGGRTSRPFQVGETGMDLRVPVDQPAGDRDRVDEGVQCEGLHGGRA